MSVVGGLFNDVLNKAAVNNNVIDWSQVRPFQTVSPMQSWAATGAPSAQATATTTEAKPMSEYEKWLATQSAPTSTRSGGGTLPESNLSDAEWAQVKQMRDEAGGWSDYDKANMMGFAGLAGAMLGVPSASAVGMNYANQAQDILARQMGNTAYDQQFDAQTQSLLDALANPEAPVTPVPVVPQEEVQQGSRAYQNWGTSGESGGW